MSKRRISGMALLILALLQRIFLMSSMMLLLVLLIFFMVLIMLLPILGTISVKTVKLMVLALICLGNNRQDLHFFFFMFPRPPRSTLFPYTTLFRCWRSRRTISGPWDRPAFPAPSGRSSFGGTARDGRRSPPGSPARPNSPAFRNPPQGTCGLLAFRRRTATGRRSLCAAPMGWGEGPRRAAWRAATLSPGPMTVTKTRGPGLALVRTV